MTEDDRGVSPSYPLIPIRSDKKSEYNRIEKYNRIDQKKKPLRCPVTFYMSEDIADTWRRYCSLIGLRVSYLTEEALLRYMRDNPAPQVTLNVTQDLAAYAPTVQDRLRNKILREKISTCGGHNQEDQGHRKRRLYGLQEAASETRSSGYESEETRGRSFRAS